MSKGPTQSEETTYRRVRLATALVMTVGIGLASRTVHTPLPKIVQKEAGDILWAMAAYWAIALVCPKWPAGRVACLAVALALLSETSQLSRAPWLETLRAYRLGRLLLGSGFSWLDMMMYPVGAAIAWRLDRAQR